MNLVVTLLTLVTFFSPVLGTFFEIPKTDKYPDHDNWPPSSTDMLTIAQAATNKLEGFKLTDETPVPCQPEDNSAYVLVFWDNKHLGMINPSFWGHTRYVNSSFVIQDQETHEKHTLCVRPGEID